MSRRIVVSQDAPANINEPDLSVPPKPLLVSSADAANVLGIGRTTLYELVKSGALTPIHLRRCVRFSMFEIEQFVASLVADRRVA